MKPIRRLFALALRRPELARRQTDEEIAFHIDARVEQLMEAGLSRDEAEAEAHRRFGDLARARQELHASAERREERLGMGDRIDELVGDARYVVRSLRRSPTFTVTVAATLALAIGANATMFGVVDRLLVRGPEHVRDPGRVMRAYRTEVNAAQGPQTYASLGYISYTLLRDQARAFDGVAAYATPGERTVGQGGDAEPAFIGYATWDLFPLLGVRPALGRFFGADEDRPPEGQHVVVLGHAFWTRHFASDTAVIGASIIIGNEPYTIVGVAPRGFTGVELGRADGWLPMSLRSASTTSNWTTTWNAEWLMVVARLKAGVTPQAASDEATHIHRAGYTGSNRSLAQASMTLAPISYTRQGRESAEVAISRWLVGVSLLVLVIACANVANLLLARAIGRRREIAVRLALGITPGRLVRLLLTESLALALLGGGAALLVAFWGGKAIRAVLLPDIFWASSPVDGRVMIVALLLTVTTGFVVGLVPALLARRQDLHDTLGAGARDSGVRPSRVRAGLLFTQSALALVLVIDAGLFARSLANVRALDLGFEPRKVLSIDLIWPSIGNLPPDQVQAERARRRAGLLGALEQVRHLPDVADAAIAVGTPFGNSFVVSLRVPGHDSIPDLGGGPYISVVTGRYFETVGTRLIAGRTFTSADGPGSERVAIVNEPMARTLWPGADPLAQCLMVFNDSLPCARVVGVVAEARRFQLREPPAMQYYVPYGQESGIGGSVLLVRPRADALRFAEALPAAMRAGDPTLPRLRVRLMQDAIDPQVRPWRLGATLFAAFGFLALAVAAIGLYSVIAYMVAQRTREFGVRLALGARGRNIAALVAARGLLPAGLGFAAGLGIALIAGRFIGPLLFETSPHDLPVLAASAASLVLVALLACLVPAWRASRVDPVVALRTD